MKRLLIIQMLFVCIAVAAHTPGTVDNPAETAGYYYFWRGAELSLAFPGNDFTKLPRPGLEAYLYIPSRVEYNVLHRTGYDGLRNYLYFASMRSKRYSPLISGALKAEAGFLFGKERLNLNADVGMLYKKTGNLDYGAVNRLHLGVGDKFYFDNRLSLTAGFNPDKDTRFTASLHSYPDIGVSWSKSFGRYYTKVGLDTKRILKTNRGLALSLTLGGSSSLIRENERILADISLSDSYQQAISYHQRYGEYTPPLTYQAAIFPVVGESSINYGLSIMKMMDTVPAADIVINVRRGDNLNRISKNLPLEADDTYRNNIAAIGLYNNLRAPYVLHPGQHIRIPPKVIQAQQPGLPITLQRDVRRIAEAISTARGSDLMEVRLNAALWANALGGESEMRAVLPVRADIANKFLLNTQSIVELYLRNPKSAIRKLRFALEIDPYCPMLNTNLAIAYYLDNNRDDAREYMLRGRTAAEEYGLDTSFHNTFLNEVLNRR